MGKVDILSQSFIMSVVKNKAIKNLEALEKVNKLCLEAFDILFDLNPHPCSVAGSYYINLKKAIVDFESRVYKFGEVSKEELQKFLEDEQKVVERYESKGR